MTCFFAPFSEKPCNGRLRKCHLIPKQTIRRELRPDRQLVAALGYVPAEPKPEELIWHPAVWVPGCGGLHGSGAHHGAFDNGRLTVPRSALPAALEAFAEEHRLGWYLDKRYGPQATDSHPNAPGDAHTPPGATSQQGECPPCQPTET